MRKQFGALLGMAALLGSIPEITTTRKRMVRISNGHTSWGRQHSDKVKRGRAKERRAKLARKINWK